MPRLFSLTIVVSFFCCFLHAVPAAAQESEKPVAVSDRVTLDQPELRIPMDHSSRHIVVRAKVNGQGPFRFQLDTGAGLEACVDLKLVEKLQLPKVGSALNSSGDPQNAVTRDIVRVDELSFGGLTAKSVRALAADYSWISSDKNDPVMGIVGFRLFQDMLLTIDYPRDEIILKQGELTEDAADVISFADDTNTPFITVSIGDRELPAMIDTGAKGTIVLTEADQQQIKFDGELRQTGMGRTVNEQFPIYSGTLQEDLGIANARFPQVVASIYKPFQIRVLGHKLLSRFVLTFDQQNQLVRLTPAGETE